MTPLKVGEVAQKPHKDRSIFQHATEPFSRFCEPVNGLNSFSSLGFISLLHLLFGHFWYPVSLGRSDCFDAQSIGKPNVASLGMVVCVTVFRQRQAY
jgi:hypothetical protein